jgi:hypothetical protein
VNLGRGSKEEGGARFFGWIVISSHPLNESRGCPKASLHRGVCVCRIDVEERNRSGGGGGRRRCAERKLAGEGGGTAAARRSAPIGRQLRARGAGAPPLTSPFYLLCLWAGPGRRCFKTAAQTR